MSGWNSLSLREKAEMMKAAIKRGITNLSDIKQLYNDSLDIDDIEKVPTYEDLSYNGDLPPVDVTAQQMRNYANGGRIYSSGGTAPSWKTRARLGLWKGLSDSRNNTGGAYSTPGNINLPAGSLRGNEAAQYAMKFFMDRGMTKYAAAGLVGNLMRESGLVPNAVNKSGKNPTYAYGIAQWLGPRRDKLFARYGSNPTLEQQLDFVWDELNTTHRSGLRALQNAKNYQDAMMAALGYYEFSAGPQGALRAILKTGQNADLAIGRGMQYAAQLMGMPNISNEDIQRIKNGYINDRNFDMSSFGVATPEAMSMQVPMENPNLSMWQPTVPEAFGMSSQPNMSGYVTKSEYDSINARLDEMAKMEQERQLAIQQEQEKAQKRAEREQARNNALFAFNLMNNSFAPQSNQNNNGFFTPIAEANPAFTPFAMVGAYGGKLGKKFAGGGSKGNYSYNRANAEEAMAYLMSEGFPRHTAAAIVGAGIRESGMNPYQHNLDGGKAYGLYQWLDQLGKGGKPVGPQRKSKLFEMYGEDAGLLPQMKYLVWEMNNVLPAWEREKILNAPDVPAAAKEFTYRFGSGQGNRSDAELRSYIASTGQDVDEAVRRAINYGNEMLDYYPDLNMWKQKWATESTSQPQDDTIIRRQTPQTDYLKPIDLNAPFQPDYNLMSTMMERPIYPYQGLYDSKAVVLPMSNTHVTDEGMLMDTRSGEQYTAAAPTLETTAPYNKEAFNVSGNVITPLIVKNNSATNNSFRRGGRLYDEGGNALMTDLALLKSSEADRANNIDELSVLPDGTLVDRYGRYGTVALPDVVVEGQTNRPQVANFEDTMALYAKDKPLERIYPEFDILAAARGLLTGGLGYTLRTLANPKTYTRTADAVVNTARAMAKPGSNFWTNPLTKAIMYGTAAGETVNAGSEALTGRTWGENVGDWSQQLTGWNPNNTILGHMVTEGTNPGYIVGGGVGNTLERLAANRAINLADNEIKSVNMQTLNNLYKKAVESGNKTKALEILEEAYLRSGVPKTEWTVNPDGTAVGWYHGSEFGNHAIFDSSAMDATIGGTSAKGNKGNFTTTDLPSAIRYARASSSTANVATHTEPQTFLDKIKNVFGHFKPRQLYPAERTKGLTPKSKNLHTITGTPTVDLIIKDTPLDHVVYPLYVNPGEKPLTIDFNGNPWSKSPVKFPPTYTIKRKVRAPEKDWINDYGDTVLGYNEESSSYDTLEDAIKAFENDPIAVVRPDNPLEALTSKKYDYYSRIRDIEGFNSHPNFEQVKLIDEYIPNTTNGAVQVANKNGNTSVQISNVIDSNGGGVNNAGYPIDDFVALTPQQQKLADITFDDEGNLIPLFKRFLWDNKDIRYKYGGKLNTKFSITNHKINNK